MEVFVFPIGHVVFHPHSAKPLNIFEPRYVQMVRDSITEKVPIALAHVDEPNQVYRFDYGRPLPFVRPLAGYGNPVILEQRPDGSLLILIQALGKLELGITVDKGTPYIVCQAQEKAESNVLDPSQAVQLMTLQKVLIAWVQKQIPEPYLRDQILKAVRTPEEVIGYFASYLIADPDMQQLILEADDINDKINLISGLISSGEMV